MEFIDKLIAKVGKRNVEDAILALEAAGVVTVDRSRPDSFYIEPSAAFMESVKGTTAEYWKQRRDRVFNSIPAAIRAY
jgi:hypothetical protein